MSYIYKGTQGIQQRAADEIARTIKEQRNKARTAAAKETTKILAAATLKADDIRTEARKAAQKEAAEIINAALTEARNTINAAIEAAADVRENARQLAVEGRKKLVEAEADAARIRERAYLEGRVRADAQRVEHDRIVAGNQRRAQLTKDLRTYRTKAAA